MIPGESRGPGAGYSPGITRETTLFRVWLHAAHGRSLPQARDEDLAEYVSLRPGDRLRRDRLVRTDLRRLGAEVAQVEDRRARLGGQISHPNDVAVVLRQTGVDDTAEWGVRVRRDAALLALLYLPHLQRAEVARLSGEDVDSDYRRSDSETVMTVLGRPLPRAEPARSCPACSLTLWLGCLSIFGTQGRDAVLTFLRMHATSWTHGHLCDDVESVAGERWRDRKHLITAVEPGGRIADEGLSSRQVSRIVSAYLDPTDSPGISPPMARARPRATPPSPDELRNRREELDEWLSTLEMAAERAEIEFEQVMRRITDL